MIFDVVCSVTVEARILVEAESEDEAIEEAESALLITEFHHIGDIEEVIVHKSELTQS